MPVLAESDIERFRYSNEPEPRTQPESTPAGAPKLVWDTPEGWTEAPATQMRDVNLRFGENGEGECYLTRLSGGGGGLVANVNRWRGQMNLPDASAEEIAALPKKPLFTQDATFISIGGDFGGMGGGTAKKDYKLLGLIYATPSAAITVKMTGPKALVEANAAKFDAFTASLDVNFGTEKPAAEPEAKTNGNGNANQSE